LHVKKSQPGIQRRSEEDMLRSARRRIPSHALSSGRSVLSHPLIYDHRVTPPQLRVLLRAPEPLLKAGRGPD